MSNSRKLHIGLYILTFNHINTRGLGVIWRKSLMMRKREKQKDLFCTLPTKMAQSADSKRQIQVL